MKSAPTKRSIEFMVFVIYSAFCFETYLFICRKRRKEECGRKIRTTQSIKNLNSVFCVSKLEIFQILGISDQPTDAIEWIRRNGTVLFDIMVSKFVDNSWITFFT